MHKLLTIVIPVYKVEKYINKCLDSLIIPDEQMKKMEVIIVNDGTPDNSAIIAKEYEKRYPETFTVIDKENGGHGSAWNKGVTLATGKYLRFLDSDDWLTNLSEFLSDIEKYDVDLIFTGLRETFEDSRSDVDFMGVGMRPNIIYSVESFNWMSTNTMFKGYNVTNFHMCTYKTELLKKFHPVFYEKMFYDDEILFLLPLITAKSFVYLEFVLYNYLLGREGQTMDSKIMLRNIDFKIKIRKYLVLFSKSHPIGNDNVSNKVIFILNNRIRDLFMLMTKLPYKESLKQMKEMRLWIFENFPSYNGCKGDIIYSLSPTIYWILYHFIQPIWSKIKLNIIK